MTTALLRQIQAQDQDELAQRYNRRQKGEKVRLYRSSWLIDTLHDRLPPEHRSLARWLLGQQAIAEGRKPQDLNRVDRSSNPAEAQMAGRLDAMRTLTGFERAVYAPLGRQGALCLRAIAWGDSFAEMMRACSFGRGANRKAVELVQVTLMTAQDHDDSRRKLGRAM